MEFEVRAINGTGFKRLHALCTGASFLCEDGHTVSTRVVKSTANFSLAMWDACFSL